MSIGRLNLHDDTSPLFFDSMTIPHSISVQTKKVEQFFDTKISDLKADLQKVEYLAKNAKGIFNNADFYLFCTKHLCVVAALCAILGGVGMACCPAEYKKTRGAFITLSILSGLVSLVSAVILFQMHSKASDYKSLFEWQNLSN